jgi:anhydro-N-acetylmuramic acid kinase
VQATLVELSAVTISNAIASLPALPARCFVCGGGAHNEYLLERLSQVLSCEIKTTGPLGTNPDYVEAIGFAWLARERLAMRTGNLAEVTQANKATVLGAIYSAG